jgi:uncharacterized protein (TIGR02271 family)
MERYLHTSETQQNLRKATLFIWRVKIMATKRAEDRNAKLAGATPPVTDERLVIPVIEEEVTVEKQIVETGKVRISKRISEREELVDVPLFREEVSVERVPINLVVEARPPVRQEGDTMIIPVVEEQIIVQKKLLLVEELRVRKELVENHQPQAVNVLKEEVDIRRVADNNPADNSKR